MKRGQDQEATVKRFHYDSHNQLRIHLGDFMAAYNFARRLKTLGGLTPYEYICKIWTSEPDRFILNPIHQMPGLNTFCMSDLLGLPRHRPRPGSVTGWCATSDPCGKTTFSSLSAPPLFIVSNS